MTSARQWWGAMSPAVGNRFLGRYSYIDIPDLAAQGGAVILPVGAVEQHGPHMPLFTDALIVQSLVAGALERLPKDHPFYYLYPLAYSYSMEHADFAGTVTLSAQTTMSVLMDIAQSLARSGFRKLVFLNGHGGNVGLLHVTAREIHIKTGLWVFVIHGGSLAPEGLFDAKERAEGIHAGASETSLVMSLMPEWVREDRILGEYPLLVQDASLLSVEGTFPVAWSTRDVSASGVMGDAEKASSSTGDVLFDGMVEKFTKVLLDIAQFQGTTNLEENAGRSIG